MHEEEPNASCTVYKAKYVLVTHQPMLIQRQFPSIHLWRALFNFCYSQRKMENITFGLELEFVTPVLQAGQIDPDEASEVAASGAAGQPRFVARVDDSNDPYSEPGYSKVYKHLVELINTVAPQKAMMSIETRPDHGYETWFVKEESTAVEVSGLGPDQYFEWNNVELTTPVFSIPISNNFQWPSSIGDVVRLIRQSCRVRTNNSCALHIHVGLMSSETQGNESLDKPGLYLREKLVTLKKLATLLWLAEDRIMSLCHPLRWDIKEGWSSSLRRSPYLNTILHKMPALSQNHSQEYAVWLGKVFESAASESGYSDVVPKMSLIWNAKNWHQLAGFLKSPMTHGKLIFDFSQLSRIGTVEFRPMEASFDEALLKHWTAVCTRLVMYANQQATGPNAQRYQNTIVNLLQNESEYSIWDLLEEIGCSAQASWFKDKCARDEREFQNLKVCFDIKNSYPVPYYLPGNEALFFPPRSAEPWDINDLV